MRALLGLLIGLAVGVYWNTGAYETGFKHGAYARHILSRWTIVPFPVTPLPDFDYRQGEWLEGFCARTRLDAWASDDNWRAHFHEIPGIVDYYDLSVDYPRRTVEIDCEKMTIKINSKAEGPEER